MTKIALVDRDRGVYGAHNRIDQKCVRRIEHMLKMTGAELIEFDKIKDVENAISGRLDIENLVIITPGGIATMTIENNKTKDYPFGRYLRTRLIQTDYKKGYSEDDMYRTIDMLMEKV